MMRLAIILAATLVAVSAKDPAEGWMGYAIGTHPTCSDCRLTYMEASWVVPDDPKVYGAFFSPWFGIETSDNMNLLQPVNPWTGYNWLIYNEYFQWDPVDNWDSSSHKVRAGDTVYGYVKYLPEEHSYEIYHSNLNSSWSTSGKIKVQEDGEGGYKTYTIAYIVMEKSQWDCDQYPPNNEVTFFDINIEYEGQKVKPHWETAYVDDHCNCRANIVDESTVKITWES